MTALLSTRTVSGRLSNIQSFPGERGEVVYATLTPDRAGERPLHRLTVSGSALDALADHLVEDGYVQLVCEIRPSHATDRVLGLGDRLH
jgi:hypothetical protein